LSRLKREWFILVLVCAALLAAGFMLLGNAWPGAQRTAWAGMAGALLVYQLLNLRLNMKKNRPLGEPGGLFPTLGLANWITSLRAAFLALLAGFIFLPRPEGAAVWAPGGLYMTAAVMDFIDGWVARVTRRSSDLGEYLDMHWDGFGVLVACLLLIQYGQAPVWYILVGLARYLYVFGMWLRQRLGLTNYPLPPNRIRRGLAGSQMGFIAVVLLPVFTPPATLVAATLFMTPFSIAFLLDWLTVSGAIKAAAPDREKSVRMARFWSALRSWLPLVLRIGVVTLLAVILTRELRTPAPHTGVLLVGFIALVLVGLGVLGRIAALAAMLMCGFILREAPLNGLYWALLMVGTGMFLTGTGRYSLWKPEDWLIFHRAGEANRPH